MSEMQSAPTVVVGVDGSTGAKQAARWAVDEAVHRDIPLRLVHVIDPARSGGAHHRTRQLAAARHALHDARVAAEEAGQQVKVETEILWGTTLTKLAEESRSAAMVCVGPIGLRHACHGGDSTAAALAKLALCPVAVVRQPAGRGVAPPPGVVVAAMDNEGVLRHAFEEARLRRASLRVLPAGCAGRTDNGNSSTRTQFDRRLARWTRLYPDVRVEPSVGQGGVERYLASSDESPQLVVTDSRACVDLCGAHNAGCSVLSVRCGNL